MLHCLLHTSVLPRYLFRCDGSVLRIRRAETVEAGEYTNRSIREFVPTWAIPKETTWGHLNLGKKNRGIQNFVFFFIRKMIIIGRNLAFHILIQLPCGCLKPRLQVAWAARGVRSAVPVRRTSSARWILLRRRACSMRRMVTASQDC